MAILYNMIKPEMSNAGLKLYVCDRPELWHLAAGKKGLCCLLYFLEKKYVLLW